VCMFSRIIALIFEGVNGHAVLSGEASQRRVPSKGSSRMLESGSRATEGTSREVAFCVALTNCSDRHRRSMSQWSCLNAERLADSRKKIFWDATSSTTGLPQPPRKRLYLNSEAQL
jgi:hypothetical protein